MVRRPAALLALAVCAALLGGCVSIKSVTGVQQDVVGKVRVSIVVCKVDTGTTVNHPGCNYQSNAGEGSSTSSQLLVGLRVPVGTGAPQGFSGTTNDGPPRSLPFARSTTYETELTTLVPPGEGRMWVGYLSDVYTYAAGANGTPARELAAAIDLELPRSADGAPFVGPLSVVPVAGARAVAASAPAGRAVTCGTSPYGISPDGTVCVDSPPSGAIGSTYNFSTRDFGVLAGKATASPGQTVSLPFNVRGMGALPVGLSASLSADTSLPGAGAIVPSIADAPLGNGSDTRATVAVAIPRDAGPGTFDVRLTGRLENGQARTGVAKLTVRDRQKPVLSKAKAKPKTFRAATKRKPRRGTRVSFTLSEAASVRATVQRCVKRAGKRKRGRCLRFKARRGAIVKTGQQPGVNRFRFNGRLRGKALKPGRYRLVLTPTDGAANVGAAVRVAFAVRKK